MLSQDEIRARSLRLSGRAPNPYTGTANDPFQEAQSRYAGPGWAQFFGGLQKTEEDANLAGKNYRMDWGGFGNAVSSAEGGSVPRGRGPSLAAMNAGDLNPLEEQAQKQFLLQQQANDAIERAKAEKAAQKAYNDAESDRVSQGLAKSYDDFVLSSAVPHEATTVTRTAGLTTLADAQQGKRTPDTIAARPTVPLSERERLLTALPGRDQIGAQKVLADIDLKQQASDIDAKTLAETVRKNKAAEALQSNSMVSPEGVELAARNYLQTGQMPPLGMGDKTTRQRIIDKAAELGGGSASLAANKADYQSDAGSLKALQKQRDAIGAFEGTARKNIDLFLDAAGKVVDTGSPMANMLARHVTGKMLGSPDQAAYDAARQVAVNEIAKITSNPTLSAQLSDSARHEVDAFNPREATLKQSVAVMRLLKKDMDNRVTELDKAITGARGRISSGGAPTAPDGFVDMVAPDGGPLHVPAGDVEKMLKAGAKRKGGG